MDIIGLPAGRRIYIVDHCALQCLWGGQHLCKTLVMDWKLKLNPSPLAPHDVSARACVCVASEWCLCSEGLMTCKHSHDFLETSSLIESEDHQRIHITSSRKLYSSSDTSPPPHTALPLITMTQNNHNNLPVDPKDTFTPWGVCVHERCWGLKKTLTWGVQ